MNALRPFLNAVLGLMLLVQGMAVAAAPHALADADRATVASDAAVPCHGDVAETADPDGAMSCCDGDCPNMTSCLLGQLAAAPASLLVLPAPDSARFAASVAATVPAAPPSLLRPPISAHA